MNNLKNKILDYFKEINFTEEGHQYSVNDLPLKISVSGLIKKYKHPVDWKSVIKSTALRRGKSEEDISLQWKKAADKGCNLGTNTHSFAEKFVYDRNLIPQTGYESAVVKFWNDLPDYIVPLTTELKMYHKEYMFAGTADIPLYNTRTKTIQIADYKTNKDLFKNFKGQRMRRPFNYLLCNSFNHYQLQLSFYQILLEQVEDVKVSGRKLIWLQPDGKYMLFDVADYTDILKDELKNKKLC